MVMDSFSKTAADWVRLRLALYGPVEAQLLMLRCFARSRSERINERTVLRVWSERDRELEAIMNGEEPPR